MRPDRPAPITAGDPRHRLVEDREQAGRHGPARRTAVVARRQLAERQEELGDDDQDRQRALELDRAGHQAEADLDRDEGDRDGTAPLEHERGLERGPQHLQRRVAVWRLIARMAPTCSALRPNALSVAIPPSMSRKNEPSQRTSAKRRSVIARVRPPMNPSSRTRIGPVNRRTSVVGGSTTKTAPRTSSGTATASARASWNEVR